VRKTISEIRGKRLVTKRAETCVQPGANPPKSVMPMGFSAANEREKNVHSFAILAQGRQDNVTMTEQSG
jgi:hypothetical protein